MASDRRARRARLIAAVRAGDHDAIRRLCREDPTLVDARNSHHNTAIGEAAGLGDLATVELLLDLGADPTQRNHGGTSLVNVAARGRHRAVAERLIAAGARLESQDAAMLGMVDELGRAIDADPDLLDRPLGRRQLTLLHHAASVGAVESVCYLLERGAALEAEGREGHTALSLTEAAGRGRGVEAARILLEAGANPDAPGGWHDGTVLHRAVMQRDVELARLLLQHGADPDVRDWSGLSPRDRARTISKKMASLFE